jgi:hypothetical protein
VANDQGVRRWSSNAAVLINVHVAAADTYHVHAEQHFVVMVNLRLGDGYRSEPASNLSTTQLSSHFSVFSAHAEPSRPGKSNIEITR